ncbi:hypothetical protein NDU88_002850 [Pleurodeles waltl]|uniref:Uncharacterized protein n=1 Tax=Pleurodeles waltl TaxID=8319 RepID=A0AAV7PB72_PLEWA|nr:hypothetical protein NDU88_002850 [Pleurodeles waltl]
MATWHCVAARRRIHIRDWRIDASLSGTAIKFFRTTLLSDYDLCTVQHIRDAAAGPMCIPTLRTVASSLLVYRTKGGDACLAKPGESEAMLFVASYSLAVRSGFILKTFRNACRTACCLSPSPLVVFGIGGELRLIYLPEHLLLSTVDYGTVEAGTRRIRSVRSFCYFNPCRGVPARVSPHRVQCIEDDERNSQWAEELQVRQLIKQLRAQAMVGAKQEHFSHLYP